MRVKYFVRSVRPALPINRLLAAGVLLSKVNRGEKELSFFVPFKQSKQVDAILERSGAAYRKKGYSGMKAMLRKALSRPFLLVSVLIAITLVIVAENFVYGYTIVGNRLVNTFRVEDVLREQGAIGITYKGRIDTAALKKSIAAIEGVSFASVKVQGNRLLVEIKEELPREYPDEAVFSPVTSLYSAVVTRVAG